jgi:hypothetical protein
LSRRPEVSALFLLIVSTLAFVALMVARPKLRRLLSENLSRRAAPISVRLFGPFSPKAFVASFVRAAKARATETHSGAFLPNYIVAGVAPAEYDSWGPLAAEVGQEAEQALRGLADVDEDFVLLGRPTVVVKRDPLARLRRPRFMMSVLRADQLDATTYRPSRPGTEDPTPIIPRRAHTSMDLTSPLVEFEVLIDGRPYRTVELGEGRHIIGRRPSSGLAIDEKSVSQRHALLTVARQFTTIKDLGSHNGVFVGKVKADVALLLDDGDLVTLSGNVQLRVLRSGGLRKAS